ncbi:hypothetical protein V2J09_022775 [Rumex salicifolius]
MVTPSTASSFSSPLHSRRDRRLRRELIVVQLGTKVNSTLIGIQLNRRNYMRFVANDGIEEFMDKEKGQCDLRSLVVPGNSLVGSTFPVMDHLKTLKTICLTTWKKLHEMGAFTDTIVTEKGSGEEGDKMEKSDEEDLRPGTARHQEFYLEEMA